MFITLYVVTRDDKDYLYTMSALERLDIHRIAYAWRVATESDLPHFLTITTSVGIEETTDWLGAMEDWANK